MSRFYRVTNACRQTTTFTTTTTTITTIGRYQTLDEREKKIQIRRTIENNNNKKRKEIK